MAHACGSFFVAFIYIRSNVSSVWQGWSLMYLRVVFLTFDLFWRPIIVLIPWLLLLFCCQGLSEHLLKLCLRLLKTGNRVLIHAGGSGFGTAATQLASLAGARAIVTAGSEQKIETAKSLGTVAGFNYKTGKFSNDVKEFIEGKYIGLEFFICFPPFFVGF